MKLDDAMASGAEAMFGEKYDNDVRVLSMSDSFSVELCGGTHVSRSGDIGVFMITSESSVSSGVRRIEAVVGNQALKFISDIRQQLSSVQGLLKVGALQFETKVKDLIDENKSLKKGNKSINTPASVVEQSSHQIN